MDEFVKEALEQLEKARKSGRPETVLEALEELIVFCEDERANLPYIEEMEKLAHSSGNKKLHLTALSFRCCAHQELENWPELRSAAEEFHRQAQSQSDPGEISTALFFLAEADLANGNLEQASARLNEGIRLAPQDSSNPVLENARAIRALSLRQKLAKAQNDLPTVELLEVEIKKLETDGQEILRRQLMGTAPKSPGAGGVLAVLVAIAVGILLATLGRS